MNLLYLLIFLPSESLAEIQCKSVNLPESSQEEFLLRKEENKYLLKWSSYHPRKGIRKEILADHLSCVKAKSDPAVVSCVAKNTQDPSKTDASFTILRQEILSPGPVFRESPEPVDSLNLTYKLYFRDNLQKLEIKRNFFLRQCKSE